MELVKLCQIVEAGEIYGGMHTHAKNAAFAKTEYYLRSKYSGLELAENYAAAGT